MNNIYWEERDKIVASQIDGHYCPDWDEMAVSAWTMEYDSCTCAGKTRLGRAINRVMVWRFNLGWWRTVGLPDLVAKLRGKDLTRL